MIRKMNSCDLDSILKIWLECNLSAHDFIPAKYWIDNLDNVRIGISGAEVYVFEDGKTPVGFIGLNGNYIEGIFVDKAHQSMGIGSALLNYTKQIKDTLSLKVYAKNVNAFEFYINKGFKVLKEGTDEAVNQREFTMQWRK